jgi:hypothetical protein
MGESFGSIDKGPQHYTAPARYDTKRSGFWAPTRYRNMMVGTYMRGGYGGGSELFVWGCCFCVPDLFYVYHVLSYLYLVNVCIYLPPGIVICEPFTRRKKGWKASDCDSAYLLCERAKERGKASEGGWA